MKTKVVIANEFTVNLFKPVPGNGSGGMLVKRTKVTRQIKLFVNIDILIAEDCRTA